MAMMIHFDPRPKWLHRAARDAAHEITWRCGRDNVTLNPANTADQHSYA